MWDILGRWGRGYERLRRRQVPIRWLVLWAYATLALAGALRPAGWKADESHVQAHAEVDWRLPPSEAVAARTATHPRVKH